MLILSHVCAEFHDRQGTPIFTVGPSQRLQFLEAPETIREDLLFNLLLSEGSLQVVDRGSRKSLESDPTADHDAAGRAIAEAAAEAPSAAAALLSAEPAAPAGPAKSKTRTASAAAEKPKQ